MLWVLRLAVVLGLIHLISILVAAKPGAIYVVAYFMIGFVSAHLCWLRHCTKKADELDNLIWAFRLEHPFHGPLKDEPYETRFAFVCYITGRYNPDFNDVRKPYDVLVHGTRPVLSRNFVVLLRWFLWWPLFDSILIFGKVRLLTFGATNFKHKTHTGPSTAA